MSESVATQRYKAKQRRRELDSAVRRVAARMGLIGGGNYGRLVERKAPLLDLSRHVTDHREPEKPMDQTEQRRRDDLARAAKYARLAEQTADVTQRNKWRRRAKEALARAKGGKK